VRPEKVATTLDALRSVIERAYDAFNMKLLLPLDVCSVCCMTPDEQAQLLSFNQRQMPLSLLYTWNHAAKTDVPEVGDFKYFLPRIFDLLSSNQLEGWTTELVLKSFRYYDLNSWKVTERNVIHDFKKSHFNHCLTTWKADVRPPISDILAMWIYAGFEVSDLLEQWQIQNGSMQLLAFACEIQQAGPHMRRNAFLTELSSKAREVDEWFAGRALALEIHFVDLGTSFQTGTEESVIIENALDAIDVFKSMSLRGQ
jgi:hypothetical protein